MNPIKINTSSETQRITGFFSTVIKKTGIPRVVTGWSGGIDSTVCLYLIRQVFLPKDTYVLHLPYKKSYLKEFSLIQKDLKLPAKNIMEVSIEKSVNAFIRQAMISRKDPKTPIRIGNIMARARMITLFDFAKMNTCLVCGTENKTEQLLGYYTRYGDAASDIEPIHHLYKTQVYALARHLEVPDIFIQKAPTAGLWAKQTDEGEFGFTYKEADVVLYLHLEKKLSVSEIKEMGYPNAERIINRMKDNEFKRQVPYMA